MDRETKQVLKVLVNVVELMLDPETDIKDDQTRMYLLGELAVAKLALPKSEVDSE